MKDPNAGPIRCPYCQEPLHIRSGGWAFRYTQILLHLDRCVPEVSPHERHEAALALTDEHGPDWAGDR